MSYQGRFQQSPKGAALRRALIAVACVAAVLVGIITAGYFFLDAKLNKITQAQFIEKDPTGQDLSSLIGNLDETEPTSSSIPETEPETEPPTTEPDYGESGKVVNIVVVGQDSREGEDSKLADSIILCTLNKETKTLTLTSFLRDSYVKLPQNYRGHTCGWNRINTSYALGYVWYSDAGAMEMLNLTLEGNYGVVADGNVEISFDAFTTIIDRIGGIELEFLGDEYTTMRWWQDVINDEYYNAGVDTRISLHEGVNLVNGDLALAYARERHVSDADNDMNRAGRQRIIIEKVIEKCRSMSILELNSLLDEVLPLIITNISTDDMKVYIKELLPYIFDLTIVSHQCPAEGTYWGEMVELPDGPGGVLKIDFEKNKKLMAAICTGETE